MNSNNPLSKPAEDIRLSPRQVAVALAAGSLGGTLFAFLGAPLAWMLGAMAATTCLALFGAKTEIYPSTVSIMVAVLGVLMGSAFTPDIVKQAANWVPSVILMIIVMTAFAAAGYIIFRRLGRYDPVTAYFSAVPGGFTEMTLMGTDLGGDAKTIALAHATRILIVVSVIPFYFRGILGLEIPTLPSNLLSIAFFPVADAIILSGCAVVGLYSARWMKLPAPAFLGPMALSALAHATGLTTNAPPLELIAIAQIIVGASIGSRFAGQTWKNARKTILLATLTTGLMIVAASLVGLGMADILKRPMEALVLALSPGGLTEMALIALTLGVNTAYVSTLHILRILFVLMAAPLVGAKISPEKPPR
ncbi:AbrB family transcriptional regulator [Parvibaculaceae bacterium PLY_AMNH_Bact1]|nr:AbrB family transcriptional regulator [Parvibaculaceae bacterium PLY_AMNH_Bact1]